MHRPFIALLVVFLAAAAASCDKKQSDSPKSPAVPKDPNRRVVAKTGNAYLSIAAKAAADGTFPLSVTADSNAEPVTLLIAARVAEIAEMSGESTAGDPLDRVDFKSMVSGEEEKRVSTWLRPIQAGESRACVLAEQEYGFEHTKRNHTVICAEAGKQRAVWSREEGQGPTWTSIDLKDLDGDKIDELIYFDGFAAPEEADRLDVTVWKWVGGELKETPGGVKTVIAAVYPTAKAARAARAAAKNDACRNLLWVLESGKGQYAIGVKTTIDVKNLPAWKAWQGCYPGVKVSE